MGRNPVNMQYRAISGAGRTPFDGSRMDLIRLMALTNRNSQNSWMWATSISEGKTTAATGNNQSFSFAMIFGTETTFSVYGWRVGRSLDRKWYERLSDNDFRKKSWLVP